MINLDNNIMNKGTNFQIPSKMFIFQSKNTSNNKKDETNNAVQANVKGIETITNAQFGSLMLKIIPIENFC